MLTIILLAIILVIYIVLLIARHKNNKAKINAVIQVVQGILWNRKIPEFRAFWSQGVGVVDK